MIQSNGTRKMGMTYKELHDTFNANETENEYVQALNELTADKRNLMILYLEIGTVTGLARKMNVSPSVMRRMINEIKEDIKDRGDALSEF